MPTYDYLCNACRKPFDVFMNYQEYGSRAVACPHCKSTSVRRRISRPRVLKGEQSHIRSINDSIPDKSTLESMQQDPRAMGAWMRKMGKESGEELPVEFNEVVDRLEKGESPQEIEQSIPGLSSDGDESLSS